VPKINNLKSVINAGKSVVGQVSGALEEVAGAGGKGGFSVSAGPNGVSISANFNELLKKKVLGNRIAGDLAQLYRDGKTRTNLFYPSDLDSEHYLMFRVMRRDRDTVLAKSTKHEVQSITLPVPSNLQVQQGASYNDATLGLAGGMAAGKINTSDITDAGASLSGALTDIIGRATEAFKAKDTDAAIKGVGAGVPAFAAAGGAKLLGSVGGLLAFGGTVGNVSAGVSLDTGLAINPHLAVVFQGVGFRVHSFQYKFIARNQDESNVIKNIIYAFQYAMLPSYTAGSLAFQYPDEFKIEFAEGISEYLYDIGTCVLESVDVQYNGEGTPLFFENSGAPVSITMSLAFKETAIHTKERLAGRIVDPTKTKDVVSGYEDL
tara:strand:+ start:345 stop:1475 length:1131 start_codon:yes stop_codon:yes gene_type:complete